MSDIIFAPKLPIPNLRDALDLYKKWVNPLLTESQKKECSEIIEKFYQNEGIDLDKKLQNYVNGLSNNKNWMVPYWTNMYLSIRESLLTESNYGIHLTPFAQDEKLDSLEYMAQWIIKTGLYYKKIYLDPPISYSIGKFTFSGENLTNLFACVRMPQKNVDTWIKYKDFLQNIIITYKDRYYLVSIFDQNQNIISLKNLKNILNEILNDHIQGQSFVSVAFLGSDNTYLFMEDFLKDPINKDSFDKFNKTICHIHLANEDYLGTNDLFHKVILNSNTAIWAYKPVNYVLWNNKQISLYMEHTGADGTYLVQLMNEIRDSFAIPLEENTSDFSEYQQLVFNYTIDDMKRIKYYHETFKNICKEYEYCIYHYDHQFEPFSKCSPDALAQILLQYGMSGIMDSPRSIYSACAMNHFAEGRTEALKPVSDESWNFVKELSKTKIFNQELFDKVLIEHKERVKICKIGHAFPRYLSGLSWMRENSDVASYFFDSESLSIINENYFSTSTVGAIGDIVQTFFFTPPKPSYYGIGYLTSKNALEFHIIYYKKYKKDFERMINKFDEFKQIFI